MKKIIILGCPGAGKSTLARRLRDKTGLPLYYLDMIWHKPDRTNITREEFDAAMDSIMSEEAWIIDGNYMRTIEKRLQKCDTAVFLDLPTEVCLAGAEGRAGTQREDLPWFEGSLDPEFRRWIIDFPNDALPTIRELLDRYRHRVNVITLRSHCEIDEFVEGI